MKNKKIALIGAGNVAHHLAPAFLKAGMNLCQIYSRTIEAAQELGKKTGITYTADVYAIYPDCDIYIFCVKPYSPRYGVLYPLQTFTKKRDLDFHEIPLCIEACNLETLKEIKELAGLLSARVEEISSEKRKVLHLAAVFANNFVNHLYGIAGKILEKEELDDSLLRPLIFETAHKVMLMNPADAQTGPARRGDESILNMHKAFLKENRKLLNLYSLMSDSIREATLKIGEDKVAPEDKPLMLTLW